MLGSFDKLSREAECERILTAHGVDRFENIRALLDQQFRTIHNRAQLLLGICGILISAGVVITTGRIIARPTFLYRRLAGHLLALAGILEIAAAAVVISGVLSVRWITQQPGCDLRAWVMSNLAYRDGKTRAYRVSIVLVLVSMFLYQAAAVIALVQL